MKRIHVLSAGFTNPNSCAFLFPLIVFRRALREAGFDIRISTHSVDALTDCDLLLIEHKSLTRDWDDERSLEILQNLSQNVPIIWCDQSDSTGTFLGQVLPFVQKYLKAQVLADLSGYKKSYYADRIYTDYYHKKYNISDNVEYKYTPVLHDNDLKKIDVSWNSGLMKHGWAGPYINRLRDLVPCNGLLQFSKPYGAPVSERSLDISCRMGIPYKRASVRYQREHMREILHEHISTHKVSRRAYLKELAQAKLCVSPFGYGEITLKDFEIFLAGSVLVKPDLSHMETWPHFYEDGVTYLSHDWDLKSLPSLLETAINDPKRRIEIATEAQNRYLRYTRGPDAAELFCTHFASLAHIEGTTTP